MTIATSCSDSKTAKKNSEQMITSALSNTTKAVGEQAVKLLNEAFTSTGQSNVDPILFQIGLDLSAERSRIYGNTNETNFLKAYATTILSMKEVNINSFSEIGIDRNQILANIPFFMDLENQLQSGTSYHQLKDSIKASLLLIKILTVTKFEPMAHEYSFLTEALSSMLKNQSIQDIYNQSIPFCVYMRIIRKSNYSPTPEEEQNFISYITQQIQSGNSAVDVGNYGIQTLILLRAIKLGYVPLSSNYERDYNEIIAPLLAQNKSGDSIVGEMTNNVTLSCSIANINQSLNKLVTSKKIISSTKLKNILAQSKIKNRGRGIAQVNEFKKPDFNLIKKFKGKTNSTDKHTIAFVKTRKISINKSEYKANASYIISIPKTSYQKNISDILISDIKKLAPKARILNQTNSLVNTVLVDHLSLMDIELIVMHGYQVYENKKIKLQSQNTCPSSQFTSTYLSLPAASQKIGASYLHAQGIRGQNIKIGIIDTGADYNHPDFECSHPDADSCRLKAGSSLGNLALTDLMDTSGHGTHVTSIAVGKTGIAPASTAYLYPIGNVYDIISLLSHSIPIDSPQVINMSFSYPENKDSQLAQVIDEIVTKKNISVVAATGNCSLMRGSSDNGTCGQGEWDTQGIYTLLDNKNIISAPASASRAIAVGVTDLNDNLSTLIGLTGSLFDNSSILKPDILAPGQLICAAGIEAAESAYGCGQYHTRRGGFFGWCDSEHVILSGSSMSAPMVSGGVALLRQKNPQWNTDEVKSALRQSANLNVGNLSAYGVFERGTGKINLIAASQINGFPPVVRIDQVITQSTTLGKSVSITGAAYDRDGLKEYRISIGSGKRPLSYTKLKSFARSIGSLTSNEVLLSISNIQSCLKGDFTLKLEAEDIQGNIAVDYALIKLN